MNRLLLLIPVAVLTLTGCTVITYNRVFPKLTFAWSREAIEQRQQERAEKNFRVDTNSPAF
jgi:hypothetical protein